MGKVRIGLRDGVTELARRTAKIVLPPFSRLVASSHSYMSAEPLPEQDLGILLGLVCWGLLACAIAARWGILLRFLVGVIVGGGMMAAWEQMMGRRSRQRSAMASNVALLGGTLSKADAGYVRVEFLNRLLKKAWPYVASATEVARPSIRDCLEHLLEEFRLGVYQVIREQPDVQRVEKYVPVEEFLTSLDINAISLGSPPTIEGLKIYRLKDGKIICKLRTEWRSDAHITLGVGTDTGIVPIVLENLNIRTTVRVVLRITESPPFVAAVVATIPAECKPTVDFTLSVVESSTTVAPKVTKRLRNLLKDFILNTFVWPHRVVLPIVPSSKALDLNELYLRLHGQLSVAIIKGENLVNLYPYVTIYCRPQFKVRTKSIENTHSPTWNEEFILDVEDQKTQSVTFQVLNENKGADELLGTVAYPLKDLPLDQDVEFQLDVQPRKKSRDGGEGGDNKTFGRLTVELRYHVYTDLERDIAITNEEVLIKVLATPDEPGSYTTAMDLMHP